MGAGIDARLLPTALSVEGFDQHQETVFGGVEMGGEFSDLRAEAAQFSSVGVGVSHGYTLELILYKYTAVAGKNPP
jgi:hypothetical protein